MKETSKATRLLINQRIKRYTILVTITVAFLILYAVAIPNYVSLITITNLFRQSSVLAILACGMTFVILVGGIDLSPGANIALSGVISALALNAIGSDSLLSAILGIVVALLSGTCIGLINGLLIGYMKIAPFIATLATMSLARGLTLYITDGKRIIVSNPYFNALGNSVHSIGELKIPFIIYPLIFVIFLTYVILNKSCFGRKTYLVGGNLHAAKASGIHCEKQIVYIYSFMGLMAGIATVLTIGRSASAQPLAAMDLEFDVITAVVLGGITLTGGAGTLGGSLLGCLLMGVMLMGVNMINIPVYYNYIIKGAFILFAVLADRISLEVATNKEIKAGAKTIKNGTVKQKKDSIDFIGNFKKLSFVNISKYFPGVQALDNVSFDIQAGTVHALAGENGAGKSTLMKILSGVYHMDNGEILIDGKPIHIKSPHDSKKKGVAIIYQELTLIPELTVTQNIFLGKEKSILLNFVLAIKKMQEQANNILQNFGLSVNIDSKANSITVGKQQMVEIARAFDSKARIVVMDEPTSALSESDKEILFSLIRKMKKQGVAIIYISHRLPEIFEIADSVTILRDGKHISTKPIEQVETASLIKEMVNREIKEIFTRKRNTIGNEILRIENLRRNGVFKNVSFSVREGEVVGMAGLIGAGRSEVARCIFGLDKYNSGKIYLESIKISTRSPEDALKKGICYVSEDRRHEGIIPLMSVKENISSAVLSTMNKLGIINNKKEKALASEYIKKFGIKVPSEEHLIGTLSGGNQQKCCLARMFACNPKVMIFDEPTRGIDVGAKVEIHKLIEKLSASGIAIIIISSELPEIIGTCDRILVMAEGEVTNILDNQNGDTTQEKIMYAATKTMV